MVTIRLCGHRQAQERKGRRMMSHQYCVVEDDGRLRVVTLNRPGVLNALHADANDELATVWDEFAVRDALWVGIVTGGGGAGILRRQCSENPGGRQAAAQRSPRIRWDLQSL